MGKSQRAPRKWRGAAAASPTHTPYVIGGGCAGATPENCTPSHKSTLAIRDVARPAVQIGIGTPSSCRRPVCSSRLHESQGKKINKYIISQPTNQPTKVPSSLFFISVVETLKNRKKKRKNKTPYKFPQMHLQKRFPRNTLKSTPAQKSKTTKYTHTYLSSHPSFLPPFFQPCIYISIRYRQHRICRYCRPVLPSVVLSQCLSARVRRGVLVSVSSVGLVSSAAWAQQS